MAFLFLFSQTFVFENSIINQQTYSVGVNLRNNLDYIDHGRK